ncbi:hypothetical protein [Tessaracoccus lacteus]|uniref:SnoaL-like domain-containing protein n=1 Tax=Tessaracoccus lacteus TaxID=3041766 RepID=A0ABY8PVZ7_9ACTN|nr:hypothetical protein [Tessaracoccus sp. T21]WGT46641.1 hypothetical protein QH948_10870 [Tessaracoccus sp. T21]
MLIAVVLLVGCAGDGGGGASESPEPTAVTTSSPVASPTPTTSPSPTVIPTYPSDLPTESAEEAAIIAGWQEYWRVFEKFAADPNGFTDFTETQYVTTDEESVGILESISSMRERGVRMVGGSVFRDVSIEVLEEGVAEVVYCADTTQMDVRYVESDEPYQPDVADSYRETATMREGKDGTWRVAKIRNEAASC